MDISYTKRKVKTTDGKQVEFTCSSNYLVPPFSQAEIDEIFSNFPETNFCVLYTTISRDKGVHYPEDSLYGVPYDNGNIGYQNGQFFTDVEEAKKSFKLSSLLTPKVGTIGYCDVYLIKKVERP